LLLGGESPSPPPLFFTDSIFRWLFAAVDFPGIEGKVKAAFTRAYNKEAHMTPYAAGQVKKGRLKDTADDLEALDGDEDGLAGEDDDEEHNEDPSLDAMIKVKKESKKMASSSGAAAASRKKTEEPQLPPEVEAVAVEVARKPLNNRPCVFLRCYAMGGSWALGVSSKETLYYLHIASLMNLALNLMGRRWGEHTNTQN
jgi:hypothetical protein